MTAFFDRLASHKLFGYKIFAIPAYLFTLILAIVVACNFMGIIPTSMIGSLGAMFMIGIVFGEVGDRLPLWKDYLGGGTLMAMLGGSLLVYLNVLSENTVTGIDEMMKSTDLITFYAAVLITGSILSIERKSLIKSFAGYIPTVLAGLVGACAGGLLGGVIFGISIKDVLLYYFLPIMGPGTGAGAVPMSQIFESAGLGTAAEFLTKACPILNLALVMSIIFGALMNALGKAIPKISGEGQLLRGEQTEQSVERSSTAAKATSRQIASGFVIACGYYILGCLCNKLVPPIFGVKIHAFAYMVILLSVSIIMGLIPDDVRVGIKKLQGFFASEFSWVIMVGVGVVYINFADLIAVLTFSNLLMAAMIIAGSAICTMTVGTLMGFYPVESAITATLCMSNSGGAGDVAVLGAAQRMNLLSWAQMSSRIGGGIMLIIASILMSIFA